MALVLVTSVTGYFVSKRLNSYGYRHREEEAAITKQINYQLKAVIKLEIAKDLRIFGMRPWINEVTEKVLAAMKAFHRQGLEISVAREVLDYLEIFRMEGGNPLAVELGAPHQICLEDVSCTYPGSENPVIAHINLTIHPGEKLAIAGLNGAGKTTLIKLIRGFLDPDSGRVLLDGEDIRQYNRPDYYSAFATVFQDFSLLAASIGEKAVQSREVDRKRGRPAWRRRALGSTGKSWNWIPAFIKILMIRGQVPGALVRASEILRKGQGKAEGGGRKRALGYSNAELIWKRQTKEKLINTPFL